MFFEAWRARARYDPTRDFQAWLLGIARKRAIDHLRRRHPHTISLDGYPDVPDQDGREIADQIALAHDVNTALAKLSNDHRTVLTLAYYDRLTQRQIAELLHTPLGTIKTRTSRALKQLTGEMNLSSSRPGT